MLSTDRVGAKCGKKSPIYPLPQTSLSPNLDFSDYTFGHSKLQPPLGLDIDTRFSFLKSPPSPELELLRKDFNILETLQFAGRIPSRLAICNWLCFVSKTESVNQYRSAILCITKQITNLDCSIKSLGFIDQEINHCLLGIRHNWVSINRDRLSLLSLPKKDIYVYEGPM